MRRIIIVFSLAALVHFLPQDAQAGWPDCKNKVEGALRENVINDIRLRAASAEVIMDPGVWQRIKYGTKINLVKAVNCYILQGDGEQMPIRVLNSYNNQVMGEGYPGMFEVK